MHIHHSITVARVSLSIGFLASLAISGCESKKSGAEPAPAVSQAVEPAKPVPQAAASAPAASGAPGAQAPTADYSREGIGSLPADCVDPNLVLLAVPKNIYESDTFDWRHARQVALANSWVHVVSNLGASKTEGTIAFTQNEHKPTGGVALVTHCATPKTCERFAAAYHTVVPTAQTTLICGPNPNIGARITGGKSVLPASGKLDRVLPEKNDVQSLCVRLAACKAARDFKLAGDETQACIMSPSKFKTSCGLKKTCDDVLTCSGG